MINCHSEWSEESIVWLRVKGGLVNKQYAVVQLAVV